MSDSELEQLAGFSRKLYTWTTDNVCDWLDIVFDDSWLVKHDVKGLFREEEVDGGILSVATSPDDFDEIFSKKMVRMKLFSRVRSLQDTLKELLLTQQNDSPQVREKKHRKREKSGDKSVHRKKKRPSPKLPRSKSHKILKKKCPSPKLPRSKSPKNSKHKRRGASKTLPVSLEHKYEEKRDEPEPQAETQAEPQAELQPEPGAPGDANMINETMVVWDELSIEQKESEDSKHEVQDISNKELKLIELIGEGNFSYAFKCSWKDNLVIVKTLKDPKNNEFDEHVESKLYEVLPPHPNVLSVIGLCKDFVNPKTISVQTAIVLPFKSNKDLRNYLNTKPEFSVRNQLNLALGMARGVAHLHKHNVVHRDIAARNFLLSEMLQVSIADFGLSRHVTKKNLCGEFYYRTSLDNPIAWRWSAPESLISLVSTKSSDIWMYGVSLWELMNQSNMTMPFQDTQTQIDLCFQLRSGLRLRLPGDTPSVFANIIDQCTKFNPEDRPSIDDIMSVLCAVSSGDVTGSFRADSDEDDHDSIYDSSKRIIYEGELIKQIGSRGRFKAWESRWFVYSATNLYYFKSQAEFRKDHSRALGSFESNILSAKPLKRSAFSSGYRFRLTTKTGEVYLKAPSAEERQRWVEIISPENVTDEKLVKSDKKKDAEISQMLHKKMRDNTKKVLLLQNPACSSVAGNNLIQKLQSMYGEVPRPSTFKTDVFSNLRRWLRKLFDRTSNPEALLDYQNADIEWLENQETITKDTADVLQKLWNCENVQQMFKQQKQYFPSTVEYFFDRLPQLALNDYYPTVNDVLQANATVSGITETRLKLPPLNDRFVIVKPAETGFSNYKKYMHMFDSVHFVMFVFSLENYFEKCQPPPPVLSPVTSPKLLPRKSMISPIRTTYSQVEGGPEMSLEGFLDKIEDPGTPIPASSPVNCDREAQTFRIEKPKKDDKRFNTVTLESYIEEKEMPTQLQSCLDYFTKTKDEGFMAERALVVVFSGTETFADQLQYFPLSICFSECQEQTTEGCMDFIKEKIMDASPNRLPYVHFTADETFEEFVSFLTDTGVHILVKETILVSGLD